MFAVDLEDARGWKVVLLFDAGYRYDAVVVMCSSKY